MKKIDCFIPYAGKEQAEKTVQGLQITGLVGNIHLVTTDSTLEPLPGCELLVVDMPHSSATMKAIAQKANTEYTLLYTKETTLELGMFALERMMHIAEDSDAGMVYADHYQIAGGKQTNAPVIDYQFGSLRDDFNFGSVLLFNTSRLKEAAGRITSEYNFAGLYDLRLKLSQNADLVHINEYLYSEVENDTRKSGEKIFDYVDPKNRNRQIEMEEACTEHLKEIGGYLEPEFKQIEFSAGNFEYEAAHGTVTRHYYKYLKGEKTSTNPMATIFAWSGAFKKRGELDNLPELVHFGEALEAASLQTLNEGIMTKDLCGLAEGITPTAVDSEGFIKAIRERLEAKLA